VTRKSEPIVSATEKAKETARVATPPQVEVATDLFDMLSMEDGPAESGSEATSSDDLWAGFQSGGETSATGTTTPPKPADNKVKSPSEIEDLFKEPPPISQQNESGKPQKDVKVAHPTVISLARHARNLESLDLSFCREMTNEALGLIADSCSSLKTLNLFGCTQITKVFTDGHSNEGVKIIGLVESQILKNIEAVELLPLRYSTT
ncbi:ARF GTPase activating protein, partial [Tanacetum coccineum]